VYLQPELSADGRRAALESRDPQTGRRDLWVLDVSRNVITRFTSGPASNEHPVWSPDGSQIAFGSGPQEQLDLYQKASSGLERQEPLLQSSDSKHPTDWSRDGRYLIYESRDPKTERDIWALPLFGERKPIPVVHRLAYTSNESGKYEVYIESFRGMSFGIPTKLQVSIRGGAQPRWQQDGRALFYMEDRMLMLVNLEGGTRLRANAPKKLLNTSIADVFSFSFDRHMYSVTPDGHRFLINTRLEESTSIPVTIVVNWQSLLRR
jgi:Tol biopolymer transport system component